jgi:hypothetical protein
LCISESARSTLFIAASTDDLRELGEFSAGCCGFCWLFTAAIERCSNDWLSAGFICEDGVVAR